MWWFFLGLILGSLMHITITKEPSNETYERGFKDGFQFNTSVKD